MPFMKHDIIVSTSVVCVSPDETGALLRVLLSLQENNLNGPTFLCGVTVLAV